MGPFNQFHCISGVAKERNSGDYPKIDSIGIEDQLHLKAGKHKSRSA